MTRNELFALFYEHARTLPIYDYHNHLAPDWLRNDHVFSDPTDLWLSSDPYKHRLMRICGLPERVITGNSDPEEKFAAWCKVFPRLIGTPVYEWSLMELSLLGIDQRPNASNAKYIWNEMSRHLRFSELFSMFNIAKLSPVEPIYADVGWYSGNNIISPSMRGDELLVPSEQFLEKLTAITGIDTKYFDGYISAVEILLDRFRDAGCKFADHALDNAFEFIENTNAPEFFAPAEKLDMEHQKMLSSFILKKLAGLYEKRGFTLLLHIGAIRMTSSRLRNIVGTAGGYAATGKVNPTDIVKLLDSVERDTALPKTVIFPLDPSQTEAFTALSGSFARDGVEALVSEGAAWWWCDHREGIEHLLDSITSYSVLDTFIGMTTDSRNILSFVRHDYFRKIVCDWFAKKLDNGEYSARPSDVIPILENICCFNAAKLYEGDL